LTAGPPVGRERGMTRAICALGVLLIAFAGFVQAVHVHSEDSKLPSHECSICAVAHAGIQATAQYRPVPVFVRTVLVITIAPIAASRGFVSALRIRPPPTV